MGSGSRVAGACMQDRISYSPRPPPRLCSEDDLKLKFRRSSAPSFPEDGMVSCI